MSRNYLTQWAKAAEEWQDANNNMLEAVEEMIRKAFNEFCKDDEDDLGVKDISSEHVKLYQHDGELEYSYEVKYVDIEDDTIIVISEDDYGNEDSRELWDLDYGDAFSVGCAFRANMDKILGTTKTYKQMIEVEKPLQTEEIKYICPSCGTEFTQGDWNYNYDSGLLDFECDCCGWTGTENQLNEEDEEDEEDEE